MNEIPPADPIPSPHLQRLLSLDTCAEILAVMQPHEFVIALLRCAGWSDKAIAGVLRISQSAVRQAMATLRRRLQAALPELRVTLAGRSQPPAKALGGMCTRYLSQPAP